MPYLLAYTSELLAGRTTNRCVSVDSRRSTACNPVLPVQLNAPQLNLGFSKADLAILPLPVLPVT